MYTHSHPGSSHRRLVALTSLGHLLNHKKKRTVGLIDTQRFKSTRGRTTAVIFLSQRIPINSGQLETSYSNQQSLSLQISLTNNQKPWSSQLPQSLPSPLSSLRCLLLVSCIVRLAILDKSGTGANKHIFSRRWARCTSMLTYSHLCSSTPLLLIILKNLKCESHLIDWLWQSLKKLFRPWRLDLLWPPRWYSRNVSKLSANLDHIQQS